MTVARSAAHEGAVAAARARLAALPADAPVRLKKKTSNLFRFRDGRGGLEVDGLDRVLHVDPEAHTADVGGMTTYEDLVAATLPHGLMPLVVPQLKTITLGGAVVGLGIESTSFRDGLPHESVLSADVLTGAGEIVTATPDNDAADLWAGLANSYGTLGYAVALRIELAPVRPFVRLRHLRFDDASALAKAVDVIAAERSYDGEAVDFVDGTVFGPSETASGRPEQFLTLGRMVDEAPELSDYTGQHVYYRSIARLADADEADHLSIHDYLWRWDTDWFWCSRALGVQHPLVRRFWPGRYRRSDVYRRLVALDRRFGLSERIQTRMTGAAGVEPIIQDVEVPADRLAEFLEFFHAEIGISPVWVCPLRLRDTGSGPRTWPLYPLEPGTTYVNVGFWSDALLTEGMAPDHHNRLIEQKLMELDGHKSLYSTSSYSREEFDALYGGEAYRRLKARYDPAGRLPDLYTKCVTG
ncbi:FAD-binding oxidoreductase [Actinomycetospora endophytica]|uniref:Delta(24)-sterol reductase n=1 Tax=Actinomycetospora endophytica TaxID=2291215 RepID=A0ABS8P9P2_9PSEU|nr:FAD-binding oxidoreductase [Actinomycetospora endophytica]MCD2194943.1 FAD-binding oxidoreductase [Actinomycetospora endophytica]